MIIHYDVNKLQEIIDDICKITGVTLSFMNFEGNALCMTTAKSDGFCDAIQKSPEGCRKCGFSDKSMVENCKNRKRAYSHVCHAGLIDTAVPIIRQDIIVGFVIIGRIRQAEDFSEVRKYFAGLNQDEVEKMQEHYFKLAFLKQNQLDSLINLISNIVFTSAIKIENDSVLSKIVEYIDSDIRKKFSIEGICRRFYISKNSLYKLFGDEFGTTVNDYINNKKMKLAVELLIQTNDSIRIVAEEVGFSNYTYFIKLFKKKHGVTPAQYRKGKNS